MKEEFEKLFVNHNSSTGVDINLSNEQLWLLTKFAKYVRLRARNNTAFNNLMNQVFPYARFEQVTKTRVDGTGAYPGLKITIKATGVGIPRRRGGGMKHPKVPIGYRRLRVGEYIHDGDRCAYKFYEDQSVLITTCVRTTDRIKVEPKDDNFYYRPLKSKITTALSK